MVGLAVIVAVVLGVATTAVAHNNVDTKLFHLDHNNSVTTALTKLTGNLATQVLKIDNNGTGPALSLEASSGKPPLTVNPAAGKATNLNADDLDGKDSTRFVEAGGHVGTNNINFKGIVQHSEGFALYGSGFKNVVVHAPQGSPVNVQINCPDGFNEGTLRIINKGEFGDSQEVWVNNITDDPRSPDSPIKVETLGQNDILSTPMSASLEHFTIRVESEFPPNRMATMELFTQYENTGCEAKAHVIYTFA